MGGCGIRALSAHIVQFTPLLNIIANKQNLDGNSSFSYQKIQDLFSLYKINL